MSTLGAERPAIQLPLINYATQVGWSYISREQAESLRGNTTRLIFQDIFIPKLLELNPGFLTRELCTELIRKLEQLPPRIEGNLDAWEYLVGLKTVFVPDEKRERNVRFIADDPNRNILQVTDEFEFTNGIHTNRYDVVFLINGVPVLFVETKSAHKIEGIEEALIQVTRYHQETPEAMSLFQIYALTHLLKFYYSATWNYSVKKLLNWRLEAGEKGFEELIKEFFNPERIIRTIRDFILFTRKDDNLEKVVLRPHQMRAVNKILERAADPGKRRGLIWHTQGSGKTYTMIVAAKEIFEDHRFDNPTVLMLVDRNELESQLFSNLRAVGFQLPDERVARSKRHLRDLLKYDTRGLIVTMIHKFDRMPANINTRENIIILVDEAHRTTGGHLGNYLMGALPNATFIGFTGTPIDKTTYGRGTFKTFGIDDPKGYLDKYSIAESIADGTTVKLYYTLAPNELKPDRETLEREFLSLSEAEGVSDIETLNKVLKRAVNLRNMLKNNERVKLVAQYVFQHFREHVEPMGYKAFLVAVDREACALYKKELDRLFNNSDYCEVVISKAANDRVTCPELLKYHYSEEKEKRIRQNFRNPDKLPKILIVTEKLLTGFDAPILYCMYLDKPMRDHVLLQAIARVNRPYEDQQGRRKTCGLILDFVGIFDRLEQALAFDSGDIKEIADVIRDITTLEDEFARMMQDARENYLSIIRDKDQDKAVEAVLDYFKDKESRQGFFEFYRELQNIYEILSPSPFLSGFLDDYETLSRIYRILREAYHAGILVSREYTRKTAEIVREHTKTDKIKPALPVYEIDEHTLKKIAESSASELEKVFSLLASIADKVKKDGWENPILFSIGERAELISQLFQARQKNTQETLKELSELITEINAVESERQAMNLSPQAFSVFRILKENQVHSAEEIARLADNIFAQYPYWGKSSEQLRSVKQELYSLFLNKGITTEQSYNLINKIIQLIRRAQE